MDSSGRRNTIVLSCYVIGESDGEEEGLSWAGYRLLTPPERMAIEARFRAGAQVMEVMAEFGLPHTSACRIQDEAALTRRRVVCSPHRLSFEESGREDLRRVCRGESDSEIARAIGRHRATVGRELRRCGERRQYRPLKAARIAQRLGQPPKPTKLSGSPRLVAAVEEGLLRRSSPQQISARLKLDHPDNEGMRISHETIYRSLYVQSRGELRRQLTASLRTGRSTRRSRERIDGRGGGIADMILIAERPPKAEERASCSRTLGGRPLDRSRKQIGDRDAGRAPDPLCTPRPARPRPEDHQCHRRAQRTYHRAARPSSEVTDLGPGPGARSAQALHERHGHARSTSAIHALPGSVDRTRTPTGYCVSTCHESSTSPSPANPNSTRSQPSSTLAPERPFNGARQLEDGGTAALTA